MKRLSFISSSYLAKNFFLYLTSTLILILFFSTQSCKSPTAPSGNGNLSLTVADVSCTEVWLNLKINNIPLPTNIVIKKNGSPFLSINLTSKDTTLYDSTLLPNKTYSYQAEYDKGFVTEKSEAVTAKTMDTTSSNFTWQTFTFGVGGDNGFNDVAVVSPTSIWAVGKFSIQDSGTYNAAHWDGKKWNYVKIQFYTVCGQEQKTTYAARSIYVFNDSTIWIGMDGDQIAVLNGLNQTSIMCLPISFGINKIWGENIKSVYVAGDGGNILHYNGQNWQKIESGTTLNIQDIWGVTDPTTGENQILCIASNIFTSDGNMLLQIKNNQAQVVSNQGLPPSYFSSVWFKNSNLAYLGGSGVFKSYNFIDMPNWKPITPKITSYYTNIKTGKRLHYFFSNLIIIIISESLQNLC